MQATIDLDLMMSEEEATRVAYEEANARREKMIIVASVATKTSKTTASDFTLLRLPSF